MTEQTNEMPLRMRLAAMAPKLPYGFDHITASEFFHIPLTANETKRDLIEFEFKVDIAYRYRWADAMIEASRKE